MVAPLNIPSLSLPFFVILKIFGGGEDEISALEKKCSLLGISDRVHFFGFIPPSALSENLVNVDVFVAPFGIEERMPYVAHTKLLEYFSYRRPIIAPDMPIVKEHACGRPGVFLFAPDDTVSLAQCIKKLKPPQLRSRLLEQLKGTPPPSSWDDRAMRYSSVLESISTRT